MVVSKTILIAHPDRETGQRLAAALFDAGFEALAVRRPEEVLRNAVGSNPRLVLIDVGMPQIGGYELRTRLEATGLEIPRIVVFNVNETDVPEGPAPEGVFVIPADRSDEARLVDAVRLLAFAEQVGGEFARGLERMHGDLTAVSFGGLLQALQQHVLTARVLFSASLDSGLWVREGAVVDAWSGEVRGVKAFNRLAGMPGGGFTLTLEEPPPGGTIEGGVGSLVVEAVNERVDLAEALDELPSLDAVPEVELTDAIFSLEFSAVEQRTIAAAQEVQSLRELLDAVDAVDLAVVRAIEKLIGHGILKFSERTGQIHILTDSTADLLPIDARRQGIDVLPVSVQFGKQVFRDGIDLHAEDFHRMLKETRELPRTHPVSSGEFRGVLERVVPSGDVIAVLCSSSLSATYVNAVDAVRSAGNELAEIRREAGGSGTPEVFVVDSHQCSGPLGLMAIFARRMADSGLPAAEIAARIEAMKGRFKTVLMVRSIDYLRRAQGLDNGRPSRSEPGERWLLALREGRLELVDRLVGPEAMERLVELVTEGIDPSNPVMGAVVQAAAPAEAAALKERLARRLDIRDLAERQLGPAVTSHNGPGTIGAGLIELTAAELEMLGPKD